MPERAVKNRMSVRNLVLLLAAPLLLLFGWAALGSCSGESFAPSAQPDAATSGHDAAPDGTTTSPPDDGAADGPSDGAAPDADAWSPDADSTWRPVDWPAPCLVEIAEQPQLAVPPLQWEDCGFLPDCQKITKNWNPANGIPPVSKSTVVAHGDGHYLGVSLSWGLSDNRAVIYDTDGSPMVVWRGEHGNTPICQVYHDLSPQRAWLNVVSFTSSKGSYMTATYPNLATATEALPMTIDTQGTHADDDTYTLWGLSGNHITIYDRLSGQATTFGPSPSYKDAYPVNDSALLRCYFEYDKPKVCIWNRSTNSIEPLINPPVEVVPNVDSDGQTIVWVQTLYEGGLNWPAGNIWTSPFATSSQDLTPQLRRPAPAISLAPSVAGEGNYALASKSDMNIHIYRLSDMHHWSFPWTPQYPAEIMTLVYIDQEELWYETRTNGLIRQRLDALGPGDPAP